MSKNLSDPKKWVMKQQTEIKHQILEEYLKRFATILHRGNLARDRGKTPNLKTVLHFVDGFAGRGIYEGGEKGSPIIAMSVADAIAAGNDGRAILKTHAIEFDPKNYASLVAEVDKAKASHPRAAVEVLQGAFNQHIGSVMAGIGEYEFAFVFIDPFGYDEGIDMATVVELITRDRTEVFITFMSSFISRFLDDHTGTKDPVMNSIFGGEGWQAFRHKKGMQEELAIMYALEVQRRAAAQGVRVYVSITPVEFPDRDQNIYHLIHLSQNPKARVAMDAAVRKTAILKPPQGMMLAMHQGSLEQIVRDHLSKCPQRKANAREVAGALWMAQEFWPLTWPDGMREAFKILEHNRVITITRDGKPLTNRMKVDEEDTIQLRS